MVEKSARLNQIIAVEKGVKSRTYAALTELHKASLKPDLFNGFVKKYLKKDEEGEELPSERKRVQLTAHDVLRGAANEMSELMEITARKDWTNQKAVGSVILEDGTVLLEDVPVSYLLFLEKQLTDLRTFIAKLPTLDEAEEWKKDKDQGLYRTLPTQTHRTKKVQRPIVLYAATEKHAAQTQLITEDVIVGFWDQEKLSGALPKTERDALVDRVDSVLRAVKEGREAANVMPEVTSPNVGDTLFAFLLKE